MHFYSVGNNNSREPDSSEGHREWISLVIIRPNNRMKSFARKGKLNRLEYQNG